MTWLYLVLFVCCLPPMLLVVLWQTLVQRRHIGEIVSEILYAFLGSWKARLAYLVVSGLMTAAAFQAFLLLLTR